MPIFMLLDCATSCYLRLVLNVNLMHEGSRRQRLNYMQNGYKIGLLTVQFIQYIRAEQK